MTSVDIIIVAAGSGLRYGAPLPKQFCILGDRPVVMHTIDAMRAALPEANIVLVISQDMEKLWYDLCRTHSFISPEIVFGGATRWESVRNAIGHTSGNGIIMVHDAVRPIISPTMISRLTAAMLADETIDGAIPAIPVTDSIRTITDDGRSYAIDRSPLRAVQTPQAFRADRLRQAYTMPYRDTFTDDASVMEAAGFSNIVMPLGSTTNIKITNPGDIAVAQLMMQLNDNAPD